jgi:hypothetical protein
VRSLKFHQGFKFDRARLASLLRFAAEQPLIAKRAAAAAMGVGEPAAEGSLGWLLKTGLGAAQRGGYGLAPLGAVVAANDPDLSQHATLWVLHYRLATEHNERAEVWYRAWNEFISPGLSFTREALQRYVERALPDTPSNKSGVSDDCREFVKAYRSPEGLGKLDLLRETAKETYDVGLHSSPEPRVFAFALFDAWQRRFPHADTLRITQICEEPELPGRVFAARRDQVVQQLQALQSLGLVNVVDSQHEPVTRRFHEAPLQLLEAHYRTQ